MSYLITGETVRGCGESNISHIYQAKINAGTRLRKGNIL
jgi:hypothetical protein